MSNQVVLVVEDEESFVEALTVGLAREGYIVEVARDGLEAVEKFDSVKPDLVLLDVMLPRMSGVDACREIRKKSMVPIIMVTAKSAELDVVLGLEMGADDYITKPYRMRELVARMRATLRRASADNTGDIEGMHVVTVGDLTINADQHEVTLGTTTLAMPLKEFELLYILAVNAGRVLTREVLIDRVWGYDYVGDTKTLDVHIKRIRAKIESDPANPSRITTIRGVGYKMERPRTS